MIKKMLSRNPKDRPTAARIMIDFAVTSVNLDLLKDEDIEYLYMIDTYTRR